MAINELSAKLKAFQESYSNVSTLRAKKSDVCFSLTSIASKLDDVISKVSQAANDTQSSTLNNCIGLAKDGLNQTKDCINQTLDSFFADCDSVMSLIEAILALYQQGVAKEQEKNSITISDDDTDAEKASKESEISRLEGEIKKINEEIEHNNKEGENMLDAMQEAMASVSFGVVGNMKKGGSLGTKQLYECNYTIKDFVYSPSEGTDDAVEASPQDPEGVNDGSDGNAENGESNDSSAPFLGEKIGGRFGQDWNDLLDDVSERWSNVNGVASFITAVLTTVYEGADFLAEGAIDTVTGALDAVNSTTNWLFDGFNPRSGTTDEYWQNIGEDYSENWSTFGETHDFWSGAGNVSVGILRTIADAAQTVGNAGVTAVDWVLDSAVGSALDWVGDALGWIHNVLW